MTTDHASFSPRRQVRPKALNKHLSRSFWIKALTDFSKSDLSVQQFCRLNSISPSNFYAWRKRLREGEANTPPAPATFIPLEVVPTERFQDLSKESDQKQRTFVFPGDDLRCHNSGLSLQLNESLNIKIDKEFHEPTLQRLVQLFSSGGYQHVDAA